jgi:hypothetical protein
MAGYPDAVPVNNYVMAVSHTLDHSIMELESTPTGYLFHSARIYSL